MQSSLTGWFSASFYYWGTFIGQEDVCLVLGDNIFYGAGLQKLLINSVKTVKEEQKAIVFGYYVEDPERYGVAEFDEEGNVLSIIENQLSRNLIMQW